MKKKLFILVIFSLLATSCTANYELNINSKSIKEKVSIETSKKVLGLGGTQIIKDLDLPVYGKNGEAYIKEIKETDENLITNYQFTHTYTQYNQSAFLKMCYNKSDIVSEDSTLSITTEGAFQCYEKFESVKITKATITIKTNLKVLKHNADKISKNKYIWIIDKDNYKNKPIQLIIEKQKNINLKFESTIFFAILIGSVLLIATLIIGFIYKRKKRVNSL